MGFCWSCVGRWIKVPSEVTHKAATNHMTAKSISSTVPPVCPRFSSLSRQVPNHMTRQPPDTLAPRRPLHILLHIANRPLFRPYLSLPRSPRSPRSPLTGLSLFYHIPLSSPTRYMLNYNPVQSENNSATITAPLFSPLKWLNPLSKFSPAA